jgi:hypothetical protein
MEVEDILSDVKNKCEDFLGRFYDGTVVIW